VLEEHLLADTDAEKRFVGCGLEHRRPQTAGVNLAHAVGHRPLAGKDHAFGSADHRRISRDEHFTPIGDTYQRLPDRAQVSHAVIDDDDRSPACGRSRASQ
jgi:hypothetical protein